MRHLLRAGLAGAALLALPAIALSTAHAAPTIEQTRKIDGGGLYELVYNPADKRLYVTATGGRGAKEAKIVELDAATLKPVGAIDVSAAPLFGLGIDTRTQTLYGTATRQGAVSAIDLATGKVTSIKADGSEKAHVRDIAVDEAADKVYVSIVGGRGRPGDTAAPPPSQVWVIDGATKRVERVIDVDTKGLTGLALDAAGHRLFGTGLMANEVVAIDLTSGAVAQRWPTGGEGPINLDYDAKGNRLFVANERSGDLSVLDAATGALKAKVPTGEGALDVTYSPAKDVVYVANRKAGTTSVVDGKSLTVVADLKTGTLPQTVVVDAASGRAFVTNKAKGLDRNAPPDTPEPVDPTGDTVTVIHP